MDEKEMDSEDLIKNVFEYKFDENYKVSEKQLDLLRKFTTDAEGVNIFECLLKYSPPSCESRKIGALINALWWLEKGNELSILETLHGWMESGDKRKYEIAQYTAIRTNP